MNIRDKIIVCLVLVLSSTIFYGQRRPNERIKALKVAFITERLELTIEEAQDFWPIYNAHEEEKGALRKKERTQIRSKLVDFESLPESEASALLEKAIAIEEEKHQLKIALLKELGRVISAKKTFLLIRAEEDFKKRLLQQIQKRKQGGGN